LKTIVIPRPFWSLLSYFDAHGCEFVVVGGYAVAHWGYPRTADDLDLLISQEPENRKALAEALGGLGLKATTGIPFESNDHVIRLGRGSLSSGSAPSAVGSLPS
jgi:hypothetical protein